MRWLWYVLFLCLMSPSWVMHVYDEWHGLDCPTPLRLFVIRPHPLFWSWKNDSIIMLEILPYDLHLDKRITARNPPIPALWLNSPSPPLNLECGLCLDPEFDIAHHYDYALLCNYTHNICTLHMISWSRMRSDPVQNMNLCAHSVRHTTHIKMFWSAESSQTSLRSK